MNQAELEIAVKDYLGGYDPSYDKSQFTLLINAVQCFQAFHEDEFSVEQILKRFVGKWDNRDAYIEEMLVEYGVESSLQDILIPVPNDGVPMFLECLNYDKIWETMSQTGALKGYINIWSENNPDFDHYFYVYDMTR